MVWFEWKREYFECVCVWLAFDADQQRGKKSNKATCSMQISWREILIQHSFFVSLTLAPRMWCRLTEKIRDFTMQKMKNLNHYTCRKCVCVNCFSSFAIEGVPHTQNRAICYITRCVIYGTDFVRNATNKRNVFSKRTALANVWQTHMPCTSVDGKVFSFKRAQVTFDPITFHAAECLTFSTN